MTKAPHIERMEAELAELDDRLTKLRAFIEQKGPIYLKLDSRDQQLLHLQRGAMEHYRCHLAARVDRANAPSMAEIFHHST